MVKTAAIYARFSAFTNGTSENTADQIAWGSEHFERTMPGVPVKVYEDDGLSASKDDVVRPDFERLKADVAAGKVGTVWASEATRLERRLIPWLTLLSDWEGHGVVIETKRDGIVKADDVGSELKGVLAADEVRRLKRRVTEGIERRAQAGARPAATTYGYRKVTTAEGVKTLEIVEDQAETIRWCAREILSGRALTAIANELQDKGVTGATGGKITASGVKSMTTNPTVAGYRHHKGALYEGTWPAILERELWESVKAALGARVKSGTRLGKRLYLLSGLIHCAECGEKMSGQVKAGGGSYRRTKTKVPFYQCKTRGCGIGISGEPVETHVADALLAKLDKLTELRNQLLIDADAEARRTEITGELSTFRDRRAEVGVMLADGVLSPDAAQAAERRLDQREAELHRELAELPSDDGNVDPDEIRRDWPYLTTEEQRGILADYIDKVTITKAQPGYRRLDLARVKIHGPGWDD